MPTEPGQDKIDESDRLDRDVAYKLYKQLDALAQQEKKLPTKRRLSKEAVFKRYGEADAPIEEAQNTIDTHRELERLAERDPLTGLYNRKAFDTILHRRFAQAKRNKSALGLIYIDVNNFKTEVNDALGHDVGDKVLQSVARILEMGSRETDIIARYGNGDEFVILLPDYPKEDHGAEVIQDRFQRLLTDHQNDFNGMDKIGLSLGFVETTPGSGTSLLLDEREFLRSGDVAMFNAKALGKKGGVVNLVKWDKNLSMPTHVPGR